MTKGMENTMADIKLFNIKGNKGHGKRISKRYCHT